MPQRPRDVHARARWHSSPTGVSGLPEFDRQTQWYNAHGSGNGRHEWVPRVAGRVPCARSRGHVRLSSQRHQPLPEVMATPDSGGGRSLESRATAPHPALSPEYRGEGEFANRGRMTLLKPLTTFPRLRCPCAHGHVRREIRRVHREHAQEYLSMADAENAQFAFRPRRDMVGARRAGWIR